MREKAVFGLRRIRRLRPKRSVVAQPTSPDAAHARQVAEQPESGRVVINGAPHEPLAPFGGFKQSGIGREYGRFGLETHLEARAILT